MVDSTARHNIDSINQSLANYSRSLHEYTLRLWTESRRKVEQRNAAAQARQQKQQVTQDRKGDVGKAGVEMTRESSK